MKERAVRPRVHERIPGGMPRRGVSGRADGSAIRAGSGGVLGSRGGASAEAGPANTRSIRSQAKSRSSRSSRRAVRDRLM